MNKKLEALQKLRDLVEYLTRIDYVPTDLRNEVKELLIKSYQESNGYFSQIEQALNELEDAKHNYKAIEEMYNNVVAYATKIQKELNELKMSEQRMSNELWKDLEAYNVVFNSFNNCTCLEGRFPIRSALDHIYQALKRNEPMKLKTKRVKVSIDDYRIDDYCPTCDEELYTTSNYCPHCGQKLDWSERR